VLEAGFPGPESGTPRIRGQKPTDRHDLGGRPGRRYGSGRWPDRIGIVPWTRLPARRPPDPEIRMSRRPGPPYGEASANHIDALDGPRLVRRNRDVCSECGRNLQKRSCSRLCPPNWTF